MRSWDVIVSINFIAMCKEFIHSFWSGNLDSEVENLGIVPKNSEDAVVLRGSWCHSFILQRGKERFPVVVP